MTPSTGPRLFFTGTIGVAVVAIIAGATSPAYAQCTDSDGDGFFYEAGCGTDQDCNDADAGVNTAAAELCDGFDNDCNGDLDDGAGCDRTCDAPEKIGADRLIAPLDETSATPQLAWNGLGYGVVFVNDLDDEDLELFFRRLDDHGRPLDSNIVQLTDNSGHDIRPAIIWNGVEYAVAWTYRESGESWTRFARLDASGNMLGGHVDIAHHDPDIGGAEGPRLAWSGAEYAVVWADNRDGGDREIYFARLDATGTKVGGDVRVTNAVGLSAGPDVDWTGAEYGVVWVDARNGPSEVYFARIGATGTQIGADFRVTTSGGAPGDQRVAWNGNEYALAWINSNALFTRLVPFGNFVQKVGGDLQINDLPADNDLALAWSGVEYGVVWEYSVAGDQNIVVARVDSSGSVIGSNLQFTVTDSGRMPSVAWNGSDFGVVWRQGDGTPRIHFARLGCNCTDGDIDGFTTCNDCDDTDPNVWSAPSEVDGLAFAADKQTVSWSPPDDTGGNFAVVYDLLRSEDAADFNSAAVCIESDDSADTSAIDPDEPANGVVYHYLPRAENDCASPESLGTDSTGFPREGAECP